MIKTSLNGNWTLSGSNYTCNAKIPGDFHSALIDEGIIKDPYYGFNEQDALWVGKTTWTIEKEFDFSKTQNAKSILEFTQADTFFTLYINNKEVGKGKNQFIRYRFDISDFLVDGKNTIKFIFDSAEKKSEEINNSQNYAVPHMKYDVYSPYRNMARKCQCHGGWDWGPCLMVSGIYGDIFIETTSVGLFQNIKTLKTKKDDNSWDLNVEIKFDSFIQGNVDFDLNFTGKNQNEKSKITANLLKGENVVNASFNIKNPEVWKTTDELKEEGLSENIPYELTVSFEDSICGTKSEKIDVYFSTLKTVSEKDFSNDKEGRCLYFENNGRKLFSKGSNWIPCDSLPSRMTKERYEDLINSAVEANMNTLRVWGGGIYENDIFYDLCNKLGIIVWQDFMFACSLYPATDDFLSDVQEEVKYQVSRLQNHPCIAIWCGNNENYGALNWFKESNENRDRYLVDYDRLYQGTIGKTVKKLDSQRIFWPSSPCAGPDDFADNWHADNMGDMHYWSVWHERKSFDAYLQIKPRFVSEFGYESFPSIDCIKSFAEEKDFNFTSPVMEYHQRSPSGNSIMLENFSRYFRFPQGFENMIYLSQVQQAVAIKTAVDWWRSLKPHCMGAIIWQLNDVWPCPSWSSIEYSGKWKLLQYATKEFFKSVYMPAFVKDNELNVVINNDTTQKLNGQIKVDFLRFDGTEYKPSVVKQFELSEDETKTIYPELLDSENKNEYFVFATMTAKSSSGKEYMETNTVFPDLYKHCDLQKPNIKTDAKKNADGTYTITLSTEKPAFFVSLDCSTKGRFSKNMITLLPNKTEEIIFTPFEKVECVEELKIYNLAEM